MKYPFNPREVLDMSGIAHRYERNLHQISCPVLRLAFLAPYPSLRDKREFTHQAASRAVVPLREAQKRDGQIAVRWRVVPADAPVIGRKVEVLDSQASRQPPFVDLVFALIYVFRVAGFVFEPMVKAAADYGNTVGQNHHRAWVKW